MQLRDVSLDQKYELADGQIFLSGVQALVRLPMLQREQDAARGWNTAGFVTGYPGSPLASYDVQVRKEAKRLAAAGVTFLPGLNEDLAMTSVWGSQQGEARGDSAYDGVFAYWYGKGAGLDRSGDALRHGNLAGSSPKGGVLLLLGDDHKAESSSVTHNSEYTMVDFMIPLLAPSSVQELLEFGLYGIALSRYSGSWVGMKCPHDVVEAAGSIEVTSRVREWVTPDHALPPEGLHIRYPDGPLQQETRLQDHKRPAIQAFARANPIDRVVWDGGDRRIGILTGGKSYQDVLEALDELGIDEDGAARLGLHLYKVGMTWPLELESALSFARGMQRLLVVEEKRALVESQLKEALYGVPDAPVIVGKKDADGRPLLPSTGILSIRRIAQVIAAELQATGATGDFQARATELGANDRTGNLPANPMLRLPSFCAGCPHNRSTVVPEGSRGGAGTGCNYMSMWMDRGSIGYTQMGADGVNWIGEGPFSKRKHVFQNMGDGTYGHSGLLAIRAAVAAKANITFKILYNGVVAMTGGQPHDLSLTVDAIARQTLAEGAEKVVVVSDEPGRHRGELPAGVASKHRDDLQAVQQELERIPGVTILIYDQMCATEKRRLRKRGRMEEGPQRVFINERVCEGCGDCGVKSNCVAVLPEETEFGRKRRIDQFACNSDYSCLEGFCPSFVALPGAMLAKSEASDTIRADDLPAPAQPALDRPWNIVLAGVGGTGVITLAAVMAMAAHLERKGCATLDMMGLAQKGGAVTSHLRIGAAPEAVRGARIPEERADLVLGCDLLALVGDEPISTIGHERSRVVANTEEVLPGDFARNPDLRFPDLSARRRLEAAAAQEAVDYIDATRLTTKAVGDAIVTNTFMLGYAVQKGLVPLSLEALEQAFRLNGVQVELNLRALAAGRRAAEGRLDLPGDEPEGRPDVSTLDALVAHRVQHLARYQNAAYAERYRDFVASVRETAEAATGRGDAFAYEVAWSLAQLMAYKDEYEVARLYSDGAFRRALESQFREGVKPRVHLAPPLLARRDPATGHLRKRSYGPWIFSAFAVLARLKVLRGTVLDPFGHTAERRTERRLVDDYMAEIEALLNRLTPDNVDRAVEIAALPRKVRGYGHIKEAAIARVEEERAALHQALDAPHLAAAE